MNYNNQTISWIIIYKLWWFDAKFVRIECGIRLFAFSDLFGDRFQIETSHFDVRAATAAIVRKHRRGRAYSEKFWKFSCEYNISHSNTPISRQQTRLSFRRFDFSTRCERRETRISENRQYLTLFKNWKHFHTVSAPAIIYPHLRSSIYVYVYSACATVVWHLHVTVINIIVPIPVYRIVREI